MHVFRATYFPGVYQIGEMYARSCSFIFVPAGMVTLKNFAS